MKKTKAQRIKPIQVYRPIGYGKASITEVKVKEKKIALDVKGTGTFDPKNEPHKTGFMFENEGVADFHIQKLLKILLSHAKSNFSTIESLAVLDLGFKAVVPYTQELSPATILIRQAHIRGAPRTNAAGIPICTPENPCENIWNLEF